MSRHDILWIAIMMSLPAPRLYSQQPLLALPFPTEKAYRCSQGPGDQYTHRFDSTRNDFDFALATGKEVTAAAPGTAYVHHCCEKQCDGGTNSGNACTVNSNCLGGTCRGGGFGNHVTINHGNGFFTLYAHLESFAVADGEYVKGGQKIATADNTGNSTGSHLHFGLHQGDPTRDATFSTSIVIDQIVLKDKTAQSPLETVTGEASHFVCGVATVGHVYESVQACTYSTSQTTQPHPNGTLVKQIGDPDGRVYLLQNGQRRWIATPNVLHNLYDQPNGGFDFTDVVLVTELEMKGYPTGEDISVPLSLPSNGKSQADGRSIKAPGNPEISIVTDSGMRRPFASSNVFLAMGFVFCKVIVVDDYNSYVAGLPIDGTEASGSVAVQATLDGAAWSGPVSFSVTALPHAAEMSTVPSFTSNLSPGGYQVSYTTGGPPESTLPTVLPSSSQTLAAGQTITFTLAFSSTTHNQPPTAGFLMSADNQIARDGSSLNLAVLPGQTVTVTFDGSPYSSDSDGQIVAWAWTLDGAPRIAGSSFSAPLAVGSHTVTLVVTDDKGATSTVVQGGIVISEIALNSTVFFDGGTDPRFQNATFGGPVLDSQGRLVFVSNYWSQSCGWNFCGIRLNSISPDGLLNWQSTKGVFGDNWPYISNDIWASNRLTLGPEDNIYLQGGRNTLFGYNSSGDVLAGQWPISVFPTGQDSQSAAGNVSFSGAHVVGDNGAIYARSTVMEDYSHQWPTVVAALNPDGSEKWRRDYVGGGAKLVLGPSEDIYTFANGRFVRIDHNSGAELCQSPTFISASSGSPVAGPDGVFSSSNGDVAAFDGNCNDSVIYSDPDRNIELRGFAQDTIFGIEYPPGRYDPTVSRLAAISKDGSLAWRNPTIAPFAFDNNVIRAIKNGVLYVAGADLADGNKSKLFWVDVSSGEILNSIEATAICHDCTITIISTDIYVINVFGGVAVANDGAVYVNDMNEPKIWKVK